MEAPGWRLTAAAVCVSVCSADHLDVPDAAHRRLNDHIRPRVRRRLPVRVRTLTEPRCCPHATASGHTRTAPQSALAGILSFVAPRSECVGCLVQGVGAGEWRRVLVDRGFLHGVLHDGVHAQARQLHPQALPYAYPPAPLPSFPAPNHDDRSFPLHAPPQRPATAVSLLIARSESGRLSTPA